MKRDPKTCQLQCNFHSLPPISRMWSSTAILFDRNPKILLFELSLIFLRDPTRSDTDWNTRCSSRISYRSRIIVKCYGHVWRWCCSKWSRWIIMSMEPIQRRMSEPNAGTVNVQELMTDDLNLLTFIQ